MVIIADKKLIQNSIISISASGCMIITITEKTFFLSMIQFTCFEEKKTGLQNKLFFTNTNSSINRTLHLNNPTIQLNF